MTKLLYMEGFDVVSCQAQVTAVEQHEGKDVVVLDQTCFYAKGGGQDFDQGIIKNESAEFKVEAVFFADGEVKHIGEYVSGSFANGDSVQCEVNTERRQLNTRLHSAGHVIDMAAKALSYPWTAGKGAHYPHMSFVEYSGQLDAEEREGVKAALQEKVDELIAHGSNNTLQFMTPEEMAAAGADVPDNLPQGKPSRAVIYDDFVVPCGGTHVKNISEIGKLTITKIKKKDGNIRVSYAVS